MLGKKITVTIDHLGMQGDGIAFYEGERLFIPAVAKGDEVEINVVDVTSEGFVGEVSALLRPSEERQKAPCPHYDLCGSCSLQHLTGSVYDNFKISQAFDALKRRNITPKLADVFTTPPNSRRRVTLEAHNKDGKIYVGYHQRRSDKVVNIKECPILRPELTDKLQGLHRLFWNILEDGGRARVYMTITPGGIDCLFHLPQPVLSQEIKEYLLAFAKHENISRMGWQPYTDSSTKADIFYQEKIPFLPIEDTELHLPAGAFIQASDEAEAYMAKVVKKHLGKRLGKVIDLFSGCGVFALYADKHTKTIEAYDSNRKAIEALQESTMGRKVGRKLTANVRNLFTSPLSAYEMVDADVVIFDPPRAGAAEQCREIARSQVKKVIGISCHPTTFARDADILVKGGYSLDKLYVIDQFLWSAHVEVIGIFSKK